MYITYLLIIILILLFSLLIVNDLKLTNDLYFRHVYNVYMLSCCRTYNWCLEFVCCIVLCTDNGQHRRRQVDQ